VHTMFPARGILAKKQPLPLFPMVIMDAAGLRCIANGVASQEHRHKLSYEGSQWCHEAHMGYELYAMSKHPMGVQGDPCQLVMCTIVPMASSTS
jgi:hypothetical protein